MVFKGASGKAAVIRAVTYDLLFNNMKSIVTKTASKPVDRWSEGDEGNEGVRVTVEGSEKGEIDGIRKKGGRKGVRKAPLHHRPSHAPYVALTHITSTPPSQHTLSHTDELKKRYEKVANKMHRRNGVVSSKGIDCSLKEHRVRWKKMDQARLVSSSLRIV